nr:putative disease resistance protein RGA3 isoform X1 [Ipomoea trifida]
MVLILLKGFLFARSSCLIPDKANIGFGFLDLEEGLPKFAHPYISKPYHLSKYVSTTESTTMADALISSVVKELINILKHQAQELKRTLGVEKEIRNLTSKLKKIREVLDDAEKKSFKEKDIELWIEDIKDFSYQVDDVLDEWRTRTLMRQQMESPEASRSSFLPSPSKFKRFVMHRDIAKKIKELDSTLDRITKEKDQFKFNTCAASHSDQESKRVTTTFDVDVSEIQGRKSDASALISKLLKNSGEEEARNGPPVISIVGAGGIGKTTLAKLVFEDEQIKTHFGDDENCKLRVWICVSDPFDQIKIAKAIVESITKKSTDLSQLQLLLEKIKSTLSGKRFLLVMDDVWTEQDSEWAPLKNSLKGGLPGSRILVTSRSERVATMMGSVYLHQLDLISDSDAWLLLSRIAFSGKRKEDCEELKDIGQKIAQRCKGLPLAARVMGSLLCFKYTRDDWQNVLDNMDEVVTHLFPHLYLSYNDLTSKMKQCFSYCAIFPKDYEIKVDMLIRIWMAQDYVTLESEGRELFGVLAMRSFFQDLKKDDMDSNIIISCKMHDIVHDFAQFLTRNECYSIDQHEDKVEYKNLRHLQSWQDTGTNMNLPSICDIGKLRSFFVEGFSPEQLTPDFFNGLKSVRVLILHACELKELPKEIGNLLHLRYIDLSWSKIKELPDAVCSLYNLQTLDLRRCEHFSRLPKKIGHLLKLRYIDLSYSKVKELPDTIHSLSNLQTLDLESCKQFSRLPDGIENLRQLRYINLSWSKVKKLPDTICSLKNLQTLVLKRCDGLSRLPEGIGNLINLRYLNISGTDRVEMMPEGIANLTQLCSLSEFKVGKESSKLGYMEKLNQLKGKLSISFLCDLNNTADVEEAEKAELRNKKHIKELRLDFSQGVDVGIDVMEALKPPSELQTLEFNGYGGSHFPSWITLSLHNLRILEMTRCRNCSSLPPLGKLPSLETLFIWSMRELRYVGREFLGVTEVGGVAFPKLKKLVFYMCLKWEEWEDLKEEATIIIMPCIRELQLKYCWKLKAVPHHLLSRLESLKIEDCPGVSVGIDALKPPLELQILGFNEYEGSHFPSWITQSLDNLRILNIWWCRNCSSLPPLGKLPSLETLLIGEMKELRYVGREFLGVTEVGGVAFPKLKKLDFYRCLEWEEWEDFKGEATTIIIMPCIRELVLHDCMKLKTVPHHLISRLQESLQIQGCPSLKVE